MTESAFVLPSVEEMGQRFDQIKEFHDLVRQRLERNVDYGPAKFDRQGNPQGKDTLLKPGAEKICMMLGLTVTSDIVSDVADFDSDTWSFSIRTTLTDQHGNVAAIGMGESNSGEGKYSWGSNKMQHRNPGLKTAEKRAKVDAALSVGGLSELFTQDLEDMPTQEARPAPAPTSFDPPAQNARKYFYDGLVDVDTKLETRAVVVEAFQEAFMEIVGIRADMEARNAALMVLKQIGEGRGYDFVDNVWIAQKEGAV